MTREAKSRNIPQTSRSAPSRGCRGCGRKPKAPRTAARQATTCTFSPLLWMIRAPSARAIRLSCRARRMLSKNAFATTFSRNGRRTSATAPRRSPDLGAQLRRPFGARPSASGRRSTVLGIDDQVHQRMLGAADEFGHRRDRGTVDLARRRPPIRGGAIGIGRQRSAFNRRNAGQSGSGRPRKRRSRARSSADSGARNSTLRRSSAAFRLLQ